MIKRTILLFTALLSSLSLLAADVFLVVETTNGGKLYFALSDNPEIAFSDQTMLVVTTTRIQDFEISNVEQYYFTDEASNISDIKNNDLRISQESNGKITIEGLQPSSMVHLYSIDGKEQTINVVYIDDNKACVNITPLPKGVYIISINDQQNIKIHKR